MTLVVSGSATLHYWWAVGPSSDSWGGFLALPARGSSSCNGGGLPPAPLEWAATAGMGELRCWRKVASVELQQAGGAGGERPVAVLDRVELEGDDGLGGGDALGLLLAAGGHTQEQAGVGVVLEVARVLEGVEEALS